MVLREAKKNEIKKIKQFVDTFEEMDTDSETFTEEYYARILEEHLLLVVSRETEIIVVCFGKYNTNEGWADILGLCVHKEHRRKGWGTKLIREFENRVKKQDVNSIDLYADKKTAQLFKQNGYDEGRTYIAFRKKI